MAKSLNKIISALDAHEFVQALPLMAAQAGKLGLLKTLQATTSAVKIAGFELAEQIERKRKPQT